MIKVTFVDENRRGPSSLEYSLYFLTQVFRILQNVCSIKSVDTISLCVNEMSAMCFDQNAMRTQNKRSLFNNIFTALFTAAGLRA